MAGKVKLTKYLVIVDSKIILKTDDYNEALAAFNKAAKEGNRSTKIINNEAMINY